MLYIWQVVYLEAQGDSAVFSSLQNGPHPLYVPMIMLVIDCVLYLLLAIYLDQVLPGKVSHTQIHTAKVALYPEVIIRLHCSNVVLVFTQVSMEWGGPWCTSWSRPIGPKARDAMWKSVQRSTQRCAALPGGASLWSRFPPSSEEKKLSGKSTKYNFSICSKMEWCTVVPHLLRVLGSENTPQWTKSVKSAIIEAKGVCG